MHSSISSTFSVVREIETNDQFPVHNDQREKHSAVDNQGIRGIAAHTSANPIPATLCCVPIMLLYRIRLRPYQGPATTSGIVSINAISLDEIKPLARLKIISAANTGAKARK